MEPRTQTLSSNWTRSSTPLAILPATSAGGDIDAYLIGLSAILQADEALLTLHLESDTEATVKVASAGTMYSQSAYPQPGSATVPSGSAINGWSSLPTGPDWSTCVLEGRMWNLLHLPVRSREAHSCLVLTLLYKSVSLNDRSRVLGKFETLRPIIEPYLRLWQTTRVQDRAAADLRAALNSIEIGVLLVDRSSKIIFANKSADAALDPGDPLRRMGESFAASDLRQAVPLQVALSHAIADNIDDDGGARADCSERRARRASILALRSQRLGRSLVLSVVPATYRAAEQFAAAAFVYIIDPKLDTTRQVQPVCALFGLSPVETRLVCLLTAGQTLQDAAVAMRIKDQTARSYLKQIFSKTDTRRQADLVRVILCSLLRTERTIEPVSLRTSN